MREIRTRISQRSGIELSNQQIQELAARRLDAILDPRGLNPELLELLRRSAGERTVAVDVTLPGSSHAYPFDEATLYDSPNALLRFFRKLLNPLLRLMFNPTPVAHALAVQSRLNAEIAAREAERDRRQAEWNALHFEILQRLALDVSRGSIEAQSLALRVESLATKVEFNERRVRSMEGAQIRVRPQEPAPATQGTTSTAVEPSQSPSPSPPQPQGEAPRRRRRRRRGRRGTGAAPVTDAASAALAAEGEAAEDEGDVDAVFEEEAATETVSVSAPQSAEPSAAPERLAAAEPMTPSTAAMNHEQSVAEPVPVRQETTAAPEPPRNEASPGHAQEE
jgi:hypothetical protein